MNRITFYEKIIRQIKEKHDIDVVIKPIDDATIVGCFSVNIIGLDYIEYKYKPSRNDIFNVCYSQNLFTRKKKYYSEHIFHTNKITTQLTWVKFIKPFHHYEHNLVASRLLFETYISLYAYFIHDSEHTEIKIWLKENISNDYKISGGIIGFSNENDMALFLLRWL